jgi:hypothetical protein
MNKAGRGGQRCPQCKATVCDSAAACARAAQAEQQREAGFAADAWHREASARLLRGELLRARHAPEPPRDFERMMWEPGQLLGRLDYVRGMLISGRLWRRLPGTAEGDA